MNSLIIAALLLVLLGLAYQTGWVRGGSLVTATGPKVHSRPQYHATYVAVWTLVPALIILALWGVFGGSITTNYIRGLIPADVLAGFDAMGFNTAVVRLQALASGYGVVGDLAPWEAEAGNAL